VPELPEVETIRTQLGPKIIDRRVISADSHESLKFLAARQIVGRHFLGLRRRGKYLIAELDGSTEMVVHLGMTGQLSVVPTAASDGVSSDNYVRACWHLDDQKTVLYRDVRRFGKLAVVGNGDYSAIPTLRDMGPEPFDPSFTGDALWGNTKSRKQRIKTQLLGQRLVAGVGNIYADEALFRAGINPAVRSITRKQAHRLLEQLREVLLEAIHRGGTTLRDYRNLQGEGSNQHYLLCYGRSGQPCLLCGTILRSRVIDARTTTWCPDCQRR